MRNTILMTLLVIFHAVSASAQFHTVTKGDETEPLFMMEQPVLPDKQTEKVEEHGKVQALKEETTIKTEADKKLDTARKCDGKKSSQTAVMKQVGKDNPPSPDLPELTIPNLYAEMLQHGIQHPKIVLAQAILETGWFRSHACRTKNNLFGLTNPRTGKYFEFGHWTESVRAYYTTVQYRYKGGNYLLWLKKIGYSEDKEYIRAVIRVLRML